jgi:hypothetical protein
MSKFMFNTLSKSALSLCTLSACILTSQAGYAATDVFTQAIKDGKATIELRPRLEYIEQDGAIDSATALTLRTVLGYETAPIYGIKAYAEMEDIRALVDNYSVPVVQPNPKYAVVADPELTQVNQAYLAGYSFKVGRQKLIVNNARFIGDVGWRQNDQTFDAVSYQNATLVKGLDLQLSYADHVSSINGQTGDIQLPVVNIKYKTPVGANLTLMWAGLEGRETAATAAASSLKAVSRQHGLVQVNGKQKNIIYDLSYAKQDSYAGSKVLEADYYAVQLGYDFGAVKATIQQESLETGFATPLATLHAFNGWADKFLATPALGLVDRNIKLAGSYQGFNMMAAYHNFVAEKNSTKYGQEIDLSVSKKLLPNLTGLLKAAHYMGDNDKATPLALQQDQSKLWLQLDYKY